MKKNEVKVGGTYLAKVTDKVVPVRLDRDHPQGGWTGTNLVTGKTVRIKSAQRLRGPAQREDEKKRTREHARAVATADQENARLRDERAKSTDGMTASERAMSESAGKATGTKKPAAKPAKRLSLINAAAQVLYEATEPMNARGMVEAVVSAGLWSTDAPTPHATLYSAILREIQTKGAEARFEKADRGRFVLTEAGRTQTAADVAPY